MTLRALSYLYFAVCLVVLAVAINASCSNVQHIRTIPAGKVTEVSYDGCTYLILEGGVTHKGNCPNPVHFIKP